MSLTVSITQSEVFQVLGNFLTLILPASCVVVRGEMNRVPEPEGSDFVVMWPALRERLSTNVDTYIDIAFIGSISGNQLTVTQMLEGTIISGLLLNANGIAANTTVLSQGSGTPGGVGVYTVSGTQTLASTTIQAGSENLLQPVKLTMQCDVHGPNSADNSQIITTLFRDEYATDAIANIISAIGFFIIGESPIEGFDVQPLYCEDPRQVPFTNAEQQLEERWIIQMAMQANPVVSVPQQFAGTVSVPITSVNEKYHV